MEKISDIDTEMTFIHNQSEYYIPSEGCRLTQLLHHSKSDLFEIT